MVCVLLGHLAPVYANIYSFPPITMNAHSQTVCYKDQHSSTSIELKWSIFPYLKYGSRSILDSRTFKSLILKFQSTKKQHKSQVRTESSEPALPYELTLGSQHNETFPMARFGKHGGGVGIDVLWRMCCLLAGQQQQWRGY